ncbi:hypothetical protein ABI59_20295 [Acidobacteria bacterium Mor1]|nr:hypothetical protein ABI59_20295 [Acidobacteria bacterium Mor1]
MSDSTRTRPCTPTKALVAIMVLLGLVGPVAAAERMLYATQPAPDAERKNDSELVRYHFKDGLLVGQELLGRFDPSFLGSAIIDGRYWVANGRQPIDLKTGAALPIELGTIRGINGVRLVHETRRQWPPVVREVDLAEGTERRLSEGSVWTVFDVWSEVVEVSPDGALVASVAHIEGLGDSKFERRLVVKDAGGAERLVGPVLDVRLAPYASTFPRPPIFWLDDARILTHLDNGRLAVVQLDGRVQALETTEILPLGSNPSIYRDLGGNVIYSAGSRYRVDLDEMTLDPTDRVELGHRFSIEEGADGARLLHDGNALGAWDDAHSLSATTDAGRIALEVRLRSGAGKVAMMVWTEEAGRWIELSDVDEFLAWYP